MRTKNYKIKSIWFVENKTIFFVKYIFVCNLYFRDKKFLTSITNATTQSYINANEVHSHFTLNRITLRPFGKNENRIEREPNVVTLVTNIRGMHVKNVYTHMVGVRAQTKFKMILPLYGWRLECARVFVTDVDDAFVSLHNSNNTQIQESHIMLTCPMHSHIDCALFEIECSPSRHLFFFIRTYLTIRRNLNYIFGTLWNGKCEKSYGLR